MTDDPFLWLEEIEGPSAVAWARAENEKTLGVLQSDPRYGHFYGQALSILQAKDRIAYVSLKRRGLENFWQDENQVRGVWRRTTLESYRSKDPQWETFSTWTPWRSPRTGIGSFKVAAAFRLKSASA